MYTRNYPAFIKLSPTVYSLHTPQSQYTTTYASMRIQQNTTFLLPIYLLLPLFSDFTIAKPIEYVRATINGIRSLVRDDRQPSLYTTDYTDCLSNSAINITRFDAAYYKDNMTIMFHLRGETTLQDHVMLNIAVFAYGEPRFSLTFNPCDANIWR